MLILSPSHEKLPFRYYPLPISGITAVIITNSCRSWNDDLAVPGITPVPPVSPPQECVRLLERLQYSPVGSVHELLSLLETVRGRRRLHSGLRLLVVDSLAALVAPLLASPGFMGTWSDGAERDRVGGARIVLLRYITKRR